MIYMRDRTIKKEVITDIHGFGSFCHSSIIDKLEHIFVAM